MKTIASVVLSSMSYWGILCLSLLILSACSLHLPPPLATLSPAWSAHQQQIAALTDWRLRGKISLRYKDERVNYKLSWQCQNQEIYFSLSTALGQKVLEFFSDSETVWLKDEQGRVSDGTSPAELIKTKLGIEIPIVHICDWGKGIPDSDDKIHALQVNDEGQLMELKQSQWHLVYPAYMPVDGVSLPRRFELQRNQIKIIVLVNEWELSKVSVESDNL